MRETSGRALQETVRTRTTAGDGFVVVGEVLADIVRTGNGAAVAHPGGSPGNVAYGLARLGATVTLVTELAGDEHGGLVRRHLAAGGVTLKASVPPSGTTATATATLAADGSATYTFDLAWTLPDAALPAHRHFHTGSIAAFLGPGADAVEQMAARARTHATVSIDPNIRPSLLPGRRLACARLDRLLASTDVVKASDEDLRWLHPHDDPIAVARRWLELGPALVVVTRGAAGASALTATGELRIPAKEVDVVDTVGAGDAFMSALLDGLSRADLLGADRRPALHAVAHDVLGEVLDRAARAAAITVSRAGARPPTAAELDAVTAQHRVPGR